MAREMMDIAMQLIVDGSGNEIGGDIAITAGDFGIVESTGEHQRQLILNNKGDFKQNPTICVGAPNYIDDEGSAGLARVIVQEFMQDGMEVENLQPNVNSIADSSVKIYNNSYYK